MPRTVGIGHQDFEKVRMSNNFYIDKTKLIREWWESNDEVTLVTRPRRFGKTLNMSMLEKFFSVEYAERDDLFEGLSIWEDEKYRKLQGTYPVISLSFANLKDKDYLTARKKICMILSNLYSANRFLLNAGILDDKERKFFESVWTWMMLRQHLRYHQLPGYRTSPGILGKYQFQQSGGEAAPRRE